MLKIFLAHSDEDNAAAADLYNRLHQQGYRPWRRQQDILGGQTKQAAIARAVKESDVFMACLSSRSINKPGYVQKEFRLALNEQAERPPASVYLIPVKLDDCEIPDLRQEEYGVHLRDLQWVDLFAEDGFGRLVQALEYAFPEHQSPSTMGASDAETSSHQVDPTTDIVVGAEKREGDRLSKPQGAISGTAPAELSRTAQLEINRLETELEDLEQDYATVSAQLRNELDGRTQNKMKRQLKAIGSEMDTLEKRLSQLRQGNG